MERRHTPERMEREGTYSGQKAIHSHSPQRISRHWENHPLVSTLLWLFVGKNNGTQQDADNSRPRQTPSPSSSSSHFFNASSSSSSSSSESSAVLLSLTSRPSILYDSDGGNCPSGLNAGNTGDISVSPNWGFYVSITPDRNSGTPKAGNTPLGEQFFPRSSRPRT